MKKINTIWIPILIISISLFSCTNLPALDTNQVGADQSIPYQTAVARYGDILISASGSGQVVPASEIDMTFDQSGTVIDILVGVGDMVAVGDVLIKLKTDKTEAQLAAEIAAAELAVVQAQNALTNLFANAETQTAQALLDLESAQLALEDLTDLELEKALALQKVALAEEAIADLEMLLYIYHSTPSDEEIYTLYASWLFKQESLEELSKQVETTIRKSKGSQTKFQKERFEDQLLQLNLQLANQKLVVENAIDKMKAITDKADPMYIYVLETKLGTAQAELAAAQREFMELEAGPKPGEVSLAQVNLASAMAAWERIKDGPDPEEIAIAETQLETARLELEVLQGDSTIVDLVATINGTVISLDVDIGDRLVFDTASSSSESESSSANSETNFLEEVFLEDADTNTEDDDSLIKIADLSKNLLEVYLDETDLMYIALDLPCKVTFEAFPDEVFIGKIIEISPELETVYNVQAIRTLIRLDETSYAKPNLLPMGLNASVEVIAGQADNVILVPVEALVEVGHGEYAVYVIENNQPQLRSVTVGLVDYTSAEVIEGLNAGEIVAIGYADTTGK